MVTMDRAEQVRQAMMAAFSHGDLDALDSICAADMVDRSTARADGQIGLEGFKKRIAGHRQGLPDLSITLDDMTLDGDRLAYRWKMVGTHLGTWLGRPATDKPMTMSGMNLERFEGNVIVEHFSFPDIFGALQQLGLINPPAR